MIQINRLNIKKVLILFLIIQPIFDLKLFYNSISTLIRVIFISLFFLYFFITTKNREKYLLLIYPILIIIYFVFHHLNALNFNSLVPDNFNYSAIKELLYFLKMSCPFMLIYSIFHANLSKKDFSFIIKTLVLCFSIIIIFSNIFVFSYGTYSDSTIKANFLEWFNLKSSFTYQDLASKGLFEFANQISAILIMFLPFTIYFTLEKIDKKNMLILFFNVFSLILLCTKVSVLGIALVFIYTVLLYFTLNNHKKNIYLIIPIFLLYLCLLPFNPSFSRMFERKQIIQAAAEAELDVSVNESQSVIDDYTTISIVQAENIISNDYKTNYIINNYQEQKINENFILNRYSYQYDPDFWYDILTNKNPNKSDYRYLEQAMVKRVIEINNNKLDKWLGITYVRVQNIFNIEKDFIMQYYSIGIIGLILFVLPYFLIIGYAMFKYISNHFKNINRYSLLAFITAFMLFAISYYSGNLLNALGFTIYFAVIFALILNTNELEK